MSSVLKRYATDPARHLEAVFRDIERTRMAGLPILNTALTVEAIGFTPWQGHWLGALITPWFLNLVLVPGAQGEWPHAAEGERIVRRLPAGDRGFYGCFEPVIGEETARDRLAGPPHPCPIAQIEISCCSSSSTG